MIMHKRGQATLFVFLGILIVAVLLIIIFVNSNIIERTRESDVGSTLSLENTRDRVNNLVNLCFTEISDKIIYDSGIHGGYSIIEPDFFRGMPYSNGMYTEDHPLFAPLIYLQCGNINLIPEISDVERTMEEAIEYSIGNSNCLDNFNEFENEGWVLQGTLIDVASMVNEKGVFLELNIPRTFSKDTELFSIDKFTYISNVNVPFYLGKADAITSSIKGIALTLGDELVRRVQEGELTEEEAIDNFRNEIGLVLNSLKGDLNREGYDFYHVSSLDPPIECSENPELFLIKNRENNFRFVFGVSS